MSLKTYGVLIDGISTEIVTGNFEDHLFIGITQFKKIGCFISVTKESIYNLEGPENIYDIRTLLGDEDGPGHLVARYLAEEIKIPRSTIFGINLKDNSLRTLRALVQVLSQIRNW